MVVSYHSTLRVLYFSIRILYFILTKISLSAFVSSYNIIYIFHVSS